MHYKNGRVAKNGDKVILFPQYGGRPIIGILYGATAGNDNCNGYLAQMKYSDPVANLAECLHFDDVVAALSQEVDDTTSDSEAKSVFVLHSPTYVETGEVVGIFATREKAEAYKAFANPPVEDGKVVEWVVAGAATGTI